MNPMRNRRKVLVPLATMLAAGAVAVGSGATFTSTPSNSVAVTAGHLVHTNNHDGTTLTAANMKPGDSLTGTVTIQNTGTLDSTLKLDETANADAFAVNDLTLKVSQGATVLYNGDFAGSIGTLDLGSLNAGANGVGDSTQVTFVVSMPSTDTDVEQGKTASASFRFVSTQKAGSSLVDTWF
jgi:spore coat-associated protein N